MSMRSSTSPASCCTTGTAWTTRLPEGRASAALPLTWEEWKRDADSIRAVAGALRRDVPERELKAHLAAARAGPDAIGENAAKIGDRIAQDEEARAAAERQAAGRVRAVQEAERQRLEEERKQDLSEGGGISVLSAPCDNEIRNPRGSLRLQSSPGRETGMAGYSCLRPPGKGQPAGTMPAGATIDN